MTIPLKFSLTFANALLLLGCVAPLPNDPDEVQHTWNAAQVYVVVDKDFSVFGTMGSKATQSRLAQIPAGKRFATLVFIHGCAGLRAPSWSFLNSLANSGFAFVAPDSYARKYRPNFCNSGTPRGDWRHVARNSEIRFAAEQLRTLPWVDTGNMFLWGHSEGGFVVAAYYGDEFKARIVTGDPCPFGLKDASSTLVIYSTKDPAVRNMRCYGAAKRLAIDSAVHRAFTFPEAQRAIHDFLEERRALP